ncbi:50S ribosomal protein L2 [bacterium]|nr:50S ribosomal protein L2 [bacterium]
MAIKVYNPTTPARRKTSVIKNDVSTKRPKRNLITIKKKNSGRNNQGKITVRHRGGEEKRYYRDIDFKRNDFLDLEAKIVRFEYDPNRNCKIMLVLFENGIYKYFLAGDGLKIGDKVSTSIDNPKIKIGNRVPLSHIPSGTLVYNVEIVPGRGGRIARSAGNYVTVMGTFGKYAQLKMPSSEIRLVSAECFATIGQVSNSEYKNVRIGKAGRMRHMGFRPTVRGKAMNACDHPHGSKHNSAGLGVANKTKWGKKAMGVKTRKPNKFTNKFIISRRKGKK